jgi:carbamate kinase
VRVVAALGGNALLRPGERADAATQRRHVAEASATLARLARRHELVVTHGNGPQVGWLALQAEAAGETPPLDLLDAETEGMIGYWIQQELSSRLPGRAVATLLTQVRVDPDDPAFAAPTKPIGPFYAEAQARRLAAERGFQVARSGRGWRRVVPSPEPREILELAAIRLLVEAGVTVVCAGGGGIPVARSPSGELRGLEAVIDKDLAAALLARDLGAHALLLLTDVPGVFAEWPPAGAPSARAPLARADVSALRALRLEPGSMGPKVEAACRFAEAGGRAAIGALEDAERVLAGEAGTLVAAERAAC